MLEADKLIKFIEYEAFAVESADGVPGKTMLERLDFCLLGVNEEAGEAIGKMKRYYRGDASWKTQKVALLTELGDVLWYTVIAAKEMGFTFAYLYSHAHKTNVGIEAAGENDISRTKNYLFSLNGAAGAAACQLVVAYENSSPNATVKNEIFEWLAVILLAIEGTSFYAGYSLEEVMEANTRKMTDRRSRGVLRGEGDNR